jgi:DNA-3-methyladenine glycosylase
MSELLPRAFYARPTLEVAQALIGKLLVRRERGGSRSSGWIVETEAYTADDPACHAARGRTERNAVMFGEPGIAYVYFIYGMYHCLNAVTEPRGIPGAVLLRAVEPYEGLERMRRRRPHAYRPHELTGGPGRLCLALGLDARLNGEDLCGPRLWVEDHNRQPAIVSTPRIGISQAADRPWRFVMADNPFVSRARPGS